MGEKALDVQEMGKHATVYTVPRRTDVLINRATATSYATCMIDNALTY